MNLLCIQQETLLPSITTASSQGASSQRTWLYHCYRPSMRLNCYGPVSGAGAPRTGFVSRTTRASCTSHVSVKALEPSPLVSLLVIGLCSRVSGWQSYLSLGLSRSPIVYASLLSRLSPTSPSPCALGQQVIVYYCLASPRRLSLYCAD